MLCRVLLVLLEVMVKRVVQGMMVLMVILAEQEVLDHLESL